MFEIIKPKNIGIGFDNLPFQLLNSKLTGNQLAKMASTKSIPKIINTDNYNNYKINDVVVLISDLIDNNHIIDAWQIILNWKKINE